MMARSLDDPASWWYFAAIHGRIKQTWAQVNTPPTVPAGPVPGDRSMWDQCQHGTWYFAPWHRGYLMALEVQLRADIVAAGGPGDWALPYWNYFHAPQMPKEFGIVTLPQSMPAGMGGQPNPLYVKDRFGPDGDGDIHITDARVNPNCLNAVTYKIAFGGSETTFAHRAGSGITGALENNPHNFIHGIIGGSDGSPWDDPTATGQPGLMSDPDSAALDPIFYMHHCAIDALWAYWNVGLGHANPTEPNWLNGPVPQFSMPWPQRPSWTYAPKDVTDIQRLDHTYDFLADPQTAVVPFATPTADAGPERLVERLDRLGVRRTGMGRPLAITEPRGTELLGASATNLPIRRDGLRTMVRLQTRVRDKLSESLSLNSLPALPDRVMLTLEGVKGTGGATALDVFVGAAVGGPADAHPERKAGDVALFGLRQASERDDKHGGAGLSFALDITDLVDALHLSHQLDAEALQVSVVPRRPLQNDGDLTVGRISVHRVTF
jgi:tyrosinase